MAKSLKKVISFFMALMMVFTVAFSAVPSAFAADSFDIDADGTLEILSIGNSFSKDTLQHVYEIAESLGVKKIAIGLLFISGSSLETHVNAIKSGNADYTYYYCSTSNTSGSWKEASSKYTISKGVTSRTWDYVMIQQSSGSCGNASSYSPYLDELISYIEENTTNEPRIVWNMTWAYQQDSTNAVFANYNNDQMTMYNATVNAVQDVIVGHEKIYDIIPSGTAVQNLRVSFTGDTITRDGYHLSYGVGRYVAALAFVKTVTGLDISKVTYRPTGSSSLVTVLEMSMAIAAATDACKNKFEVTEYVEIKPDMFIGGYWNSASSRYNSIITDEASISPYYAASARLTKEDLPVGSYIFLNEGWLYRPEGWVVDEIQPGRPDQVTSNLASVTDEWWGDYTIRAFNIKQNPSKKLDGKTADDIYANFSLYVPKDAHVHNIVDNICTLCGYEAPEHVHDYEATETKSATCTEAGVMTYTCACGDTYTEEIAKNGHALTAVEAKAPTCNEAGYEAYEYCTACDYTTFKAVDALNHKDTLVSVDAKAPTCTEAGYEAYEYCTACDYTTFKAVDALNHKDTLVSVDAKAPNCYEAGYEAYEYCTACDYTTFKAVDALNHKDTLVSVEAKAPTCYEAGYEAYEYCTACNYTTFKAVDALNHKDTLVSVGAKAPTCYEAGYEAYEYCTACDYTTFKAVDALNHKDTLVSVDAKAPTCYEAGYEAYEYCTACDYTTFKAVDALNHKDTLVSVDAKAPTCYEAGYEAYEYCTACAYTTFKAVDALNHKDTLVSVDAKAPTCNEAGYEAYEYCTACDYTTFKAVDTLNHKDTLVSVEAKAPTCTEAGYEAYEYCTACDYTTFKAVDALNHKDTLVSVEAKAPTCYEAGYEAYEYCTACDYTTFKAVDALNHKDTLVSVEAKAPTCNEAGYEAYEYCTACDYTTFKSIDSINHEYSEYRIEKEPTCDEYGVAVSECIHGCGLTVAKPIKPLSHNYICTSSTPATCGYDATETYNCEYCDAFYTIVIENTALEHSFTDYEEVTVSTCGSAGVEVAFCDHGCGATDEKTVPARDHLFLEYIYNEDATCKEDGTKTAVCVYNCGETHTVTAEDTKIGHVDEDADKICDECEAEIVDVCENCGKPVHESEMEDYICIVISLIKLINSFMNEVIIPLISIMMEAQ